MWCRENHKRPKYVEDVPQVVFDAQIQMPGTPTLQGHRLAAEMICDFVYQFGGLNNSEIAAYKVTVAEQIACCWWAGQWGPRKYRKAWGEWSKYAGHHLWYGCINVEGPPCP